MGLSIFSQKETNIFTSFLEALKVKHTREYSNKFFNEHPHKNNLFGISKMLTDYGVDNQGIKINDKNDITDIETPFIAHIGNDFVTVLKVTSEKVLYVWNNRKLSVSVEEFKEIWTGIVLLGEADNGSVENGYYHNWKMQIFNNIQKAGLFILSVILIMWAIISNSVIFSFGYALSLLVNMFGVYIGYLLVLKQLHIRSSYADKICSLFHENDCNNILESRAAKLWGIIGWSEIGFSYFISNVLVLIFMPSLINYLTLINICALPYTIWSVWYQKFVAKQWCVLCLIVQATLWAIFIINLIFGYISFPDWQFTDFIGLMILYGIPFLLINLFLPKIIDNRRLEQVTQEMNSLKASEEVFVSLLKKQPQVEYKNITSVKWGNPDAKIIVTILTNPHCGPCAYAHDHIEKLMEHTEDKISFQYVFSSFHEKLDTSGKFLLAVYLQKNKDEAAEIYHQWFKSGKYDKDNFMKKWNVNIDDERVEEEYKMHQHWHKFYNLTATPMVYVNGYRLPSTYYIDDLRYFCDVEI